jgi:pyruvate kinase
MRPIQLVATIGPASSPAPRALAEAGATALRLNASHLDAHALEALLATLRRDVPGAAIVVDLQGAKMRLGRVPEQEVGRGERVTFALHGDGGVALPHPEFFEQARAGETLSIDDGRLRFTVEAARADRLEATALDAGRLLPRKGVNLVEHPIELRGLTPTDREAVAIARRHGVTEFAFSFMSDGREAGWLRTVDPACRVIGKVERREAIEALSDIARQVDGVWICRGDLGAQLGAAALARFVASLDPDTLGVPVLMAGQVLEHLTAHAAPTRSEVCHLYDLLARGYAGLVLSDETAIGADPVRAVRVASSLLAELARAAS